MIEVRKVVQAEYKTFLTVTELPKPVTDDLFELATKRVNDLGIRSLFSTLIYEHSIALSDKSIMESKGTESKESEIKNFFECQLPFISEMIIAIQYCHNHILDNKGGVSKGDPSAHSKVKQCLLGGNQMRNSLEKYINKNVFNSFPQQKQMLREYILDIFEAVDNAQYIQLHYGGIQSFCEVDRATYSELLTDYSKYIDEGLINRYWVLLNSGGIDNRYEWFTKSYLLRVQMSSAFLFKKIAELIARLTGMTDEKREDLCLFAMNHGVLGQLVNDNNDYAMLATACKNPEDAYADLKNNIITLPLILFLQTQEYPKRAFNKMYNFVLKQQKLPMRFFENVEKTILLVSRLRNDLDIRIVAIAKKDTVAEQLNDMNSLVELGNNRFYQYILSRGKQAKIADKKLWNYAVGYRWNSAFKNLGGYFLSKVHAILCVLKPREIKYRTQVKMAALLQIK